MVATKPKSNPRHTGKIGRYVCICMYVLNKTDISVCSLFHLTPHMQITHDFFPILLAGRGAQHCRHTHLRVEQKEPLRENNSGIASVHLSWMQHCARLPCCPLKTNALQCHLPAVPSSDQRSRSNETSSTARPCFAVSGAQRPHLKPQNCQLLWPGKLWDRRQLCRRGPYVAGSLLVLCYSQIPNLCCTIAPPSDDASGKCVKSPTKHQISMFCGENLVPTCHIPHYGALVEWSWQLYGRMYQMWQSCTCHGASLWAWPQ